MVVKSRYILLGFLCLIGSFSNAQLLLDQPISIDYKATKVAQILDDISEQKGFSFSYNPDALKVDREVNLSVAASLNIVIDSLFKEKVRCTEAGNYVIIQPKKNKPTPKRKTKELPQMSIKGTVVDMRTGKNIGSVSIYQLGENHSTLSSTTGNYNLSIPQPSSTVNVRYSKKNYIDTIIIVEPLDTVVVVKLRPYQKLEELPIIEIRRIEANYDNAIEQHSMTRVIVSEEQLAYSNNFQEMETREFQFSAVPIIGTNGLMSGAVINKLSFNLLGGYSGGIDGFEIGAFVNLVKEDVKGTQIAGFANLVGDDLDGVQLAGFVNNVQGTFSGVQVAGFTNIVFDSIIGGVQLAGFNNLALWEAEGIQVAGFDNIALKKVGEQYAGFVNLAGKESVIQSAGFANISGTVVGGQLAGFVNIAGDSSRGVQFAGFANVVSQFKGMQTAGFINIAGTMKGMQLGIINISDSLKGIPLGLFSYSRKGYHAWEVSANDFTQANIGYRTGTKGLHNIYNAGVRFDGNKEWYSLGLGLGTRIEIGKKWSVNLGGTTTYITDFSSEAALSFLNTGGLDAEFKPLKRFAVFAGVTYNYMLVDNFLTSEYSVAQNFIGSPKVTSNDYTTNYEWVGFKAGLRF
jgi:hypothetical protein